MSEQTNDLQKEFIKQVLRHGGLYTDLFEIELVIIVVRIMAHSPTPHQLQYAPLKGYVTNITCLGFITHLL